MSTLALQRSSEKALAELHVQWYSYIPENRLTSNSQYVFSCVVAQQSALRCRNACYTRRSLSTTVLPCQVMALWEVVLRAIGASMGMEVREGEAEASDVPCMSGLRPKE